MNCVCDGCDSQYLKLSFIPDSADIKINDKIVLETNEDRARAFLRGVKFLNKSDNTDIKLVTVEIQEIKDED